MEKIAKLFQENSEQILSNVGTAGGVGLGGWIGITIGVGIILFIIGGVIALIVSKKMFEKQIRENPPITEGMIRAMYMQMGRKPSEAQIRAVMRSVKNAKK
ncbi:YneF family protein [Mesomycoplasma ovipneumoniae]|uniref:YneF family protein n=2 Tax=Mesomycoplasma ovipneumoniae TaxID=29562 RepID=A0AAJ2P6R2_9BACT|nr:YneF family protein [Mesomycoplasma ovipneumoniae]MDW2829820.1 YneF family protein [Mesomycoplasma ovipneumoniae]MDW2835690.1 YneF family protein [Mesomycoplasma ovipneumoniae]MDW2871011.1 YneF family protein [Mesomycoplasma ovipneumoniae]MDW2892127.1 YneF family protein [Mesomycoplasma ovipneumoniae]MDW2892813.1 YneF family protein [Mesomycoplasma ovipneumoniae]